MNLTIYISHASNPCRNQTKRVNAFVTTSRKAAMTGRGKRSPKFVFEFAASEFLQDWSPDSIQNPQDGDDQAAMEICKEDFDQTFGFRHEPNISREAIDDIPALETPKLSLYQGKLLSTPSCSLCLSTTMKDIDLPTPSSMSSISMASGTAGLNKRTRPSSSLSKKPSKPTLTPLRKRIKLGIISPARVTNLYEEFVKNSNYQDPPDKEYSKPKTTKKKASRRLRSTTVAQRAT